MRSNSSVSIIRRRVKHARLRVHEDESVELIAPIDLRQEEIDSILRRKSEWIGRQQEFFRIHPRRPLLQEEDEIMLFGETFRFISVPQLGRHVIVDEKVNTVQSGRELQCRRERYSWYRHFARRFLSEQVRELSHRHGLPYRRLFVRSQRTRWGSCSKMQNISLNWRLVTAPKYVLRYVILHELLHTRMMNHTRLFRVHLDAVCPDQEKAIEWLRQNSPKYKQPS